MMFEKKKEKFDKTVASDGNIIYTRKNQFKKDAKDVYNSGGDVRNTIVKLQRKLKEKVIYQNKITSQAVNPNKRAERGSQFKGRMEDLQQTQSEINNIISQLRKYGVIVNRQALARGKVMYEGGHRDMLKTSEIKSMKLDVFEENAQGKISDSLRDYMLIVLESVSKKATVNDAYLEAVNNVISARRDDFVDYVHESYNSGLITSLQKEVMLEMADDDFLFEAPTPDKIPDLVTAYVEAAKEGDEVKKAEIKNDIEAAKAIKDATPEMPEDMGTDDENGTVTEGADKSILETLEGLKANLTDEERQMAERFDEMIKKGCADGKCDDDDEDDDDDDDKGCGKEACGSSKEACGTVKETCGSKEACGTVKEACGTKEACGSSKEGCAKEGGCGSKEACGTAKEACGSSKEGCAKEGGCGSSKEACGTKEACGVKKESVISSSLTQEEADEMRNFMLEAVNDNVYSEEDMERINRTLAELGY